MKRSNLLLWWAFLDDGSHFVSKTYRNESGQRPGSTQHDINDEPFDCWAASLWEEPICDHARLCCGTLHGIQWHSLSCSLNHSRQKSVTLGKINSQRLGVLDLVIEELVKRSNQLLWWALLDDGPHFVSKTY